MKQSFTFQLFTLSKSLNNWPRFGRHLFCSSSGRMLLLNNWPQYRASISFVSCRNLLFQRWSRAWQTRATWGFQAQAMRAGMVTLLFWSLVRFNCARNSRVDDVSRLQGCDMKAEGLWALSRKMHVMWMYLIFSTSSPLVPYLMRAFLSRSGLGPSRSIAFLGRLWFSPCSLCQALLSAPRPPLVGFLARRPSAFSFSVPPLVFRLSNCSLIFIVISFSSFLHLHLHLIRRGLKKPRAAGRVCGTFEKM